MNFTQTVSMLSLTAVLGILLGCQQQAKSPDVTDSVRRSLDQAGLKDVSVSQDRDKGVVTLSGTTTADTEKGQAEAIARSIGAAARRREQRQGCGHAERLKQVLTSLGEKATAKKCLGMIGIVEEAEEMMDQDFDGAVMDAALISAAQRVEHYEIAAYGCVHAWAQVLGEKNAASLLEKTLDEEKETDEKLTELAEEINAQANSGSADDESAGSNESSNEEENIHVSKPRSRTAGA